MSVLSKGYHSLENRMYIFPNRMFKVDAGSVWGYSIAKAQRRRQDQGPYAEEDQRGHLIHFLNINPYLRQDHS